MTSPFALALWCALPVMTPPAAETGRSAASQFPRRPGSQTVAHNSGDTTEENMSPRRATAGRPAVTAAQRWVLALASVASFLVILDALVVATALTTIQRHLGASLAGLEWTINAYTLSFAVLLMTAAALGDRPGRRCSRSHPRRARWPKTPPR